MNAHLARWPALSKLGRLPASLVVERAVWGKVHGQPSDFRWIARSPGIIPLESTLESELGLGIEDAPNYAVCWRALPELYVALHLYPSRARDAAGRTGFLEKQLLVWPRQHEVPPVLAAMLLLPQVAEFGDEIWWPYRASSRWWESDFALPIKSGDSLRIVISAELASAAIARGIAALDKLDRQREIGMFYDDLRTGKPPALLRGFVEPLSAEALAALLLPLDPEQADKLSLAGWVPSSRISTEELARRWVAVVAPPGLFPAPTQDRSEASEQAGMMAAALLADEPEVLLPQFAFQCKPRTRAVQDQAELDRKAEKWRQELPRLPRPGLLLPLTPPDRPLSEIFQRLFEFARAADRRWLNLDRRELEKNRRSANDPEVSFLLRWVRETEAFRPPKADEKQWAVKIDLLRAAVCVLVRDPKIIEVVGKFTSGKVSFQGLPSV